MNQGGFRTGLSGGRFNVETEGFINRARGCRESPGNKMTICILFYSLSET